MQICLITTQINAPFARYCYITDLMAKLIFLLYYNIIFYYYTDLLMRHKFNRAVQKRAVHL